MVELTLTVAIVFAIAALAIAFWRPGGLSTPEQDEDDMQAQAEYLERWRRDHA